jgi:uncharacterized protein DUF885
MRFGRSVAWVGVLLAAAVVVASDGAGGQPAGAALNPQFEQFVDRYLKEGRGGGGDLSAATFARRVDDQRKLLRDLQSIDRKTLTFDQDIDYRWLESLLKTNILKGERMNRWKQDPRVYMNINEINYKLDADPRPPARRAAELADDLKVLETRIANGKQNLTQHIPRWVELSTAMADGIIVVFEKTIPAFAARLDGPEKAALTQEATRALAAVKDFRTFITAELPKRPAGDYKIGADLYNALHETEDMFDDNDINLRRIARGSPGFTRVPGYYDWGWKQFNIVLKQLEVKARQIDPNRTWLQIIREMKQDHPSSEQLVFAHLEAARRSRQWVIDKDLVTIPWKDDDAIMVAAAPNQWMTQWWGWGPGVPAGSKSRKAAWTIIPLNPEWSDEVAEANLTEKDYSFMNVIAPHEVYPGHHLQRLYQNEIPRPLRVYNSSYSNQSWCYYIEWELAPNYGFYPKEKQALYELESLRTKLWRMERVIVDAGLHTGKIGYDEAIQLESERIGFVRRGAQINIDGIAAGGSDTAAPTLGYFEWMLLREDYFKKMRELDQKGTLKDFHDRIYKIGFMPVTLVREALFHQLEQEFRPKATSTF